MWNYQESQFFYNQMYLIALDITENKLFQETIKKSIPKYWCKSKAFKK